MAWQALLAEGTPQHGQTVIAVGPKGQAHDQAQDDPVDAKAEDLASLAGQNRVEEDATQGDLGAAFVAQRVINGDPDQAGREEMGEQQQAEEGADLVPAPGGGAEQVIDGIDVLFAGTGGDLPDFGEGARAGAEEPGDQDVLKVGEGLLTEGRAEGG